MTFTGPQSLEDQYLALNAQTALARAQADQKYGTGNWANVARLLTKWGDQAPTLPPGASVALAHAGIDPGDPLGLKIIDQAVPQLPTVTRPDPPAHGAASAQPSSMVWQPPPAQPGALPGMAPLQGLQGPTPAGAAPPQGLQGPAPGKSVLSDVGSAIGGAAGAVGGAISSGYGNFQSDVIAPINRLAGQATSAGTGGAETPTQAQAALVASPGQALQGGLTALNAGLQAANVAVRAGNAPAAVITGLGNAPGPGQHGTVRTSPELGTLFDPHQITLYNQLTGQTPTEAAQTQAEAAARASSIVYNGQAHAYTVGRGLASSVVTPGTRPYSIISGITDAVAANELDPAAAVMRELSDAHNLARTFTAVPNEAYSSVADHLLTQASTSDTMTALREWTGQAAADQPDLRTAIIDKLQANPGAASALVDQGLTTQSDLLKAIGTNALGGSTFMRRHVNQPNALSWLNGTAGNDFAQQVADNPSFTSIWHLTGKKLPVNLVSALASANNPEDVKFIIASELGTTLAKDPSAGFGWLRPLEDIRLLHALPDIADTTDRQQMVEQAERHLIAANVPRAEWDSVLKPIADSIDAVDIKKAYVDGVGNKIAKTLTDTYGLNETHARALTRFFPEQSDDMRAFAVDQMGDTPHMPGVTIDGQPVRIDGPELTNEFLNRGIPALDGRALTQATTRWRAALNLYDNQGTLGRGLEGYSHFLDFVTHTFKAATLIAPRVMTRFLADEQAAMASDGMDSMFSHPIKYLAWLTTKDHRIPFTDTTFHVPGTGQVGQTDLLGQDWLDLAHDNNSTIAQAIGHQTLDTATKTDPGKLLLKNWTTYGKDAPQYLKSWYGEVSNIATDPVAREVARAIRDPENYAPAGLRTASSEAVGNSLLSKYFVGDSLNEAGQALFHNDPAEIDRIHGIMDDMIASRLGSAIRRGDERAPDSAGAVLRASERDFEGTSHETADVLASEYEVHKGRMISELRAAGGTPDPIPGVFGLDAVKQAFRDGSLSGERNMLARANLEWGSKNLADGSPTMEAWSNAYIDALKERVLTKTSGTADGIAHPDILNAVADGGPFRIPGKIDPEFMAKLRGLVDEVGPTKVKGRIEIPALKRQGWDRFVEKAFSALMDSPTTTLTRNPAFRQAYFDKAPDILPFMDAGSQQTFLDNAEKAGVYLKPAAATGALDAESADAIIKAHALEQVRKILYYPGERVGVTDKLRNIAPFADAWRRVIARWSTLATEHPQIIRRAQMGVTALQQNGFFHPDPSQGGQEVFTYPFSAALNKATTGVPFAMTGNVSGLNIVGQGLPGVGPAITMPAAALLRDIHNQPVDALKAKLFPYGLPDLQGGLLESFFPGWADKLRAGGYLQHIPFLGEPPSQQESMTIANLSKDIFSYRASAGLVNMHDPASIDRAQQAAQSDAKIMYGWMGLAQFVAPAAPHIQREVKLKNGTMVETYFLAQDYGNMLKATGDSYKATQQFIQKYGTQRIFATEPKAQRLIFGVGTGPEAVAFKSAHSQFARLFPDTYGYWAPATAATSKGSYQDYLDQLSNGIYAPLSLGDWTKLAEARVGNTAYNQARQMVGASPNSAQRDWLAQVKQILTDQYPGFGIPVGEAKLSSAQKITQVASAVESNLVPAGPLTTAARAYVAARNMALTEAKNRGYKSLSGKHVADLRTWLYQAGTTIATKTPEFTTMWNDLFLNEVDPNRA